MKEEFGHRRQPEMMFKTAGLAAASFLFLLGFLSAWSQGIPPQSFEQVAPKPIQAISPPPPPVDGPMPDLGGDETELASHLGGIVIVSSPQELSEKNASALLPRKEDQHVRFVSGVSDKDQKGLRPLLAGYIDKPVSMAQLNEILSDIILYYRGQDRPIVDAYLPEQNMIDDVVEVVVTEAKLGKVTVEGNNWFPSYLISDKIRETPGGPITASTLNSDISWINRNPFMQTELVYQPGEDPGTTDVVLKTRDRFPVRFYTGYEDSGNTLTGEGRFLLGFNWGNAFGIGDQLNYQYMTSTDLQLLRVHSGSYVHQLPWHHLITIFGSYADTTADFPPSLLLNSTGSSWQTSIRYTVPIKQLNTYWGNYTQELVAGYDFKESSSELLFNSAPIPGASPTTDVSQFVYGYNSSLTDPWGSTAFTGTGYYSPGEMTQANSTALFNEANASSSNYMYGHLTLNRVQKLPYDFSLILKGAYQMADARLLGSEQMGLGGYDTVRGYDEREANGDVGYFVSGEVRTPPVGLGHYFVSDYKSDQLQFLAFSDYGGVSQYKQDNFSIGGTPSTNPNINLWSVGGGLRYSISTFVSVRFDYGWQLIDSDVNYLFREHDGSRGHLGIVVSY